MDGDTSLIPTHLGVRMDPESSTATASLQIQPLLSSVLGKSSAPRISQQLQDTKEHDLQGEAMIFVSNRINIYEI